MSIAPSRAITELRRIFREYDAGKMSEAEYSKQAHVLQSIVEAAFSSGQISESTYDRFDKLYVENMYYVNDM